MCSLELVMEMSSIVDKNRRSFMAISLTFQQPCTSLVAAVFHTSMRYGAPLCEQIILFEA